jgi:autotransporter adhesin
MNKSYKPVLNKSTGTYVDAGDDVKSRGRSLKNKLAMKLASASFAFGTSVAMLSPLDASAKHGEPVSAYQGDVQDAMKRAGVVSDDDARVLARGAASSGRGSTGSKRLSGSSISGAQLPGATQMGGPVFYHDSTNNSIAFPGATRNERRIMNAGPGVNGTDAVNVSQTSQLRADLDAKTRLLQRAAFGGVAAAMAMPNLKPSAPGKFLVTAGIAHYEGL